MSVDLQVAFPQEAIKISSVQRVPGTSPPVLDIIGDDFTAVDEVLLNDIVATDFAVLMPAFLVSEITAAFQIGFLLFLPFIVIDLVISNILLAMGMMMVSPVTISLPLKLFLFVMLDGWTRLIQGLVLSYA